MPKPIWLTPALITQMMEEFGRTLSGMKLSDGKVSYTKAFKYEKDETSGAIILFEPVAYAKMLMLLHSFGTEVAWHGTVERLDDTVFVIKDIFVYPQVVTGGTVNTDQEKYQTWMMGLDDDIFNDLHMQGHSHVYMSTTPSAVDTNFYDSILSQLGDDDYYIFMVFNKRLERTVKIYDMKSNTLYENDDVSIGIRCEDGDLEQFIQDAKSKVSQNVAKANYANTTFPASANGYSASATPSAGAKETKKNEVESPAANNHRSLKSCPGYYGYNDAYGGGGIDYDAEIFGRRTDWWND